MDAKEEDSSVDEDEDEEEEEDEDEEKVDPRVKEQLEKLNQWTEEINKLEKLFEESNANFRCILNESSDKLKSLAAKYGKSVEEARPYYEAKKRAKETQLRCQKAAVNYEKACQLYKQAKETISLTEAKFAAHQGNNSLDNLVVGGNTSAIGGAAPGGSVNCTGGAANHREFDNTWQEMLNQATIKLMKAEAMKKESQLQHQRSMRLFRNAEEYVTVLDKQLKSSIKKSKPYFEEQNAFQEKLSAIKAQIESLSVQITQSKNGYSETLKNLERISEEIHERRNRALARSLKREPGVGAEDNETDSFKENMKCDIPELNLNSSRCQIQIIPKAIAVFESPSTAEVNYLPPRQSVPDPLSTKGQTGGAQDRCESFDEVDLD